MEDVVASEEMTGGETSADETTPLPPVRRNPGMRPAMVVGGIAVLLVLFFGLIAAFSGQTPQRTISTKPVKVSGTSLLAIPAATELKPLVQPGSPPRNIVDAVTIPSGTTATAHADNTTSAGQYDEQMDFRVTASQAAVIAFYRTELATKGWKIASVGPATDQVGTTQVLAQAAGDDGWYWEIGALVSPTVFNGQSQSTPFTLRLFQVPDDD